MTMMIDRRQIMASLATAALAAGAGRAGARTAAPGFVNVRAMVDKFVAEGRVPGAVIALVTPGRHAPQFIAAGQTAFDGGTAMTPDSLFRIYSMTKPITAMAVMQQVAAGALALDMPISEVLPEFKAMRVLVDPARGLDSRLARTPITIRHLLTHTAGLTYTIIGNGPLEKEYRRLGLMPGNATAGVMPGDGPVPDLKGFVAGLAGLPLHAEPGTVWRYSVSHDLMGGLLERLTGKPFDQVLADQLLTPLGMRSTSFGLRDADKARLSSNYAWVTPDLKPIDKPVLIDGPGRSDWVARPRLLAGGAGLLSSARDYARFGQMLLDEGRFEGRTVMPRGAVRAAVSNLMPAGVFYEGSMGFGAGGRVSLFDTMGPTPAGSPAGVYGWGGAAGTLFQVDPVRQVAVAVMLQYLPQQRFPLGGEFQAAMNRDLAVPART